MEPASIRTTNVSSTEVLHASTATSNCDYLVRRICYSSSARHCVDHRSCDVIEYRVSHKPQRSRLGWHWWLWYKLWRRPFTRRATSNDDLDENLDQPTPNICTSQSSCSDSNLIHRIRCRSVPPSQSQSCPELQEFQRVAPSANFSNRLTPKFLLIVAVVFVIAAVLSSPTFRLSVKRLTGNTFNHSHHFFSSLVPKSINKMSCDVPDVPQQQLTTDTQSLSLVPSSGDTLSQCASSQTIGSKSHHLAQFIAIFLPFLLFCCFVFVTIDDRTPPEESLIFHRSIGIQAQTTRDKSSQSLQLIDINSIKDVVINEGIVGWRIVYYLAILTASPLSSSYSSPIDDNVTSSHADFNRVVVPFQRYSLPLSVLIDIRRIWSYFVAQDDDNNNNHCGSNTSE